MAIRLRVYSKSVCTYMIGNEVKQMKELYLDAELEVVKFTACDVIATSAAPVTTTAESLGPTDDGAWDDI